MSSLGGRGFAPACDTSGIEGYLKYRFPDHQFSIEVLMNLDSSNMQPEHWSEIAANVFSSLGDSDGVIITHGTDTMAYTSSALGFMMRGIEKPVTLTGSQIPFGNTASDAPSNLSLAVASLLSGIKGVTVSFGNAIINGVRAVKTSTSSLNAFESVGVPPMAVITNAGLEISSRATVEREGPPVLENYICPDVFLLKIVPGTNPEIFDAALSTGCRGIVVESFGAGNIPFIGRDISEGVSRAVRRGVPVIARSQCLRGYVDLSAYETGVSMREAGAIPAGDMTTEAAVTKLMWALGKTDDISEVERVFRVNYAGEITI